MTLSASLVTVERSASSTDTGQMEFTPMSVNQEAGSVSNKYFDAASNGFDKVQTFRSSLEFQLANSLHRFYQPRRVDR